MTEKTRELSMELDLNFSQTYFRKLTLFEIVDKSNNKIKDIPPKILATTVSQNQLKNVYFR